MDKYHDIQAKLDFISDRAYALQCAIEDGKVPSDLVVDNIGDAFESITVADQLFELDYS